MKTREEAAPILRQITTLPTLPAVATRVMEMTQDPDCSQNELTVVVEQDPTIAARLLRLVNSPFYGISGTIGSVQQALIFVGMTNVRNLVLSVSIADLFDNAGSVGAFSRRDLWIHSMATAIAARAVARQTRAVDAEAAFTAGLIHDFGKIIIDGFFHEEFERVIELIGRYEVTMADVETSVLGMDHCEIGEYVATRWNLPDTLKEAIGYHHDPESAPTYQEIAALINVADAMVRELNIGLRLGYTRKPSDAVLEKLGLNQDAYDTTRDNLAEHIEDAVGEMIFI